MRDWKEWLQVAGMVLGAVLLVFVILAFAGVFVVIGLFAVGVMAVAWLCGLPITVKRKGKLIGYYKRTTFYPVHPLTPDENEGTIRQQPTKEQRDGPDLPLL